MPDSVNKRYLDVFVFQSEEPGDNGYFPGAAVVRLNDGVPDAEGKADQSVKSSGFTNRYQTNSVGFSKSVSGNQASRNQYFKFTVKLTGDQNVDGNTRVKVSGVFLPHPDENMATQYAANAMAAANTLAQAEDGGNYVTMAQLTANTGKDFYLKDGQSVLLTGIPDGMGYEVSEVPEDYTPSVEVNGDSDCTPADSKVTDSNLTQDTALAFVNTRKGVLPATGVSAALALPAAVMMAGIAAIMLIFVRRMRKNARKGTASEQN